MLYLILHISKYINYIYTYNYETIKKKVCLDFHKREISPSLVIPTSTYRDAVLGNAPKASVLT